MNYNRLTCRSCGSTLLEKVLDLGKTPLPDVFPDSVDTVETFFDLSTSVCTKCWLLQLDQDIPDDILFGHDYGFFTGASPSSIQYFKDYADSLKKQYPVQSSGYVFEIASNDGTLLANFKADALQTLGIDPAQSVADMANQNAIATICSPFNHEVAKTMAKADLIMANNVLAHVVDPVDFLKGVKEMLSEDGVAVIEFQYALDLLYRNQFDHFYHEHRSFLSITSLEPLAEKAGLYIQKVERTPAQGGSLRVHLVHPRVDRQSNDVTFFKVNENRHGLTDIASYLNFAKRIEYSRSEILRLLNQLKEEGKTIHGYGASAKSAVMLNACNIDSRFLDCVVDVTPWKFGKYTPGTKIQIVDEHTTPPPDVFLLLVWNYLPGIIRRKSEYLAKGGKFLVPVPVPQLI
jgi:SAM-dependent methyltransferase